MNETMIGLLFILPVFGAFVMVVMPKDMQSLQGWLMVSYIGIPAFLVVIAVLLAYPMLLFGALFLAGVLAVNH